MRTEAAMTKPYCIKPPNSGLSRPFWFFFLLICLTPVLTSGQAAAEAAGATSVSSSAATGAKVSTFPSSTPPQAQSKSPHLLAPIPQRPEITNRQALEQKSGTHPGKLLLRSTPSAAQVWINGMFVGSTPLLLVVAPGKYHVELRGMRMEHAVSAVDLLPNETRTVALALSARYPTRASVP
jgi:hypothetical protein